HCINLSLHYFPTRRSSDLFYGKDRSLKHNTQNILCYVLDQTLRLLHPIMPFVTEEIWLAMPHDGTSLVTAAYPQEHAEFENKERSEEHASELQSRFDIVCR